MKFFLDTASLKDISWAAQAGLIDGITTNPSLLAKQAGDLDPRDVLKEICSLVDGPVSAEVVAVDADAMVREGQELAQHRREDPDARGGNGRGAAPRRGRYQDQCHVVLLKRAVPDCREGGRGVCQPVHRAPGRCG